MNSNVFPFGLTQTFVQRLFPFAQSVALAVEVSWHLVGVSDYIARKLGHGRHLKAGAALTRQNNFIARGEFLP
ncbi:MAG TPA: hypothetical protein DCF61_02560 [Alphaproteobacteria bacterium]|nr:hypothetical protein [Alphaproteobacteria bacterium]